MILLFFHNDLCVIKNSNYIAYFSMLFKNGSLKIAPAKNNRRAIPDF